MSACPSGGSPGDRGTLIPVIPHPIWWWQSCWFPFQDLSRIHLPLSLVQSPPCPWGSSSQPPSLPSLLSLIYSPPGSEKGLHKNKQADPSPAPNCAMTPQCPRDRACVPRALSAAPSLTVATGAVGRIKFTGPPPTTGPGPALGKRAAIITAPPTGLAQSHHQISARASALHLDALLRDGPIKGFSASLSLQ